MAIIRSPSYPPSAGQELLSRLRGWAAQAQDVGEVARGVVPASSSASQGGATRHQLPGIAKKAKAPDPPELLGEAEVQSLLGEKSAPSKPERKEKKRKKKKTTSSSESRHRKKKAKKSRSPGRSPIRRRAIEDKEPLLDVKKEEEAPEAEAEKAENRVETPKRSQPSSARVRSPSRSPRSHRERKLRPSEKPPRWEGPIRAWKPQPPPGQGKHNGKYKGKGKELRNDAYWRRKREEGYYW